MVTINIYESNSGTKSRVLEGDISRAPSPEHSPGGAQRNDSKDTYIPSPGTDTIDFDRNDGAGAPTPFDHHVDVQGHELITNASKGLSNPESELTNYPVPSMQTLEFVAGDVPVPSEDLGRFDFEKEDFNSKPPTPNDKEQPDSGSAQNEKKESKKK